MKLFDYHYQEDFGHEHYLNVLCSRYLNVLQLELMWDKFPSTPELSITFGGTYKSILGFYVCIWKFRFSFGFLCYGRKNLDYMRIGYEIY